MTYDFVIIGGGAAGLSAAIYAARYQLKTLLLTREIGGTINLAHQVENYPGFPSLSGFELGQKFLAHLQNYDLPIKYEEVINIHFDPNSQIFEVLTPASSYQTRSLLLATGTDRRKLGIPGENKFLGQGVSYCATCDAAFFKEKKVAVVGGGDAAVTAALLVAEFAKEVILINRSDQLAAEPIWIDRLRKTPRAIIIKDTNVTKAVGDQKLEKIILDRPFQGQKTLAVDGLFIEIGSIPKNDLAKKLNLQLDPRGQIMVNEKAETNLSGVFAAGDISTGLSVLKQVVTSAAGGATAAASAYKYVKSSPCLDTPHDPTKGCSEIEKPS